MTAGQLAMMILDREHIQRVLQVPLMTFYWTLILSGLSDRTERGHDGRADFFPLFIT